MREAPSDGQVLERLERAGPPLPEGSFRRGVSAGGCSYRCWTDWRLEEEGWLARIYAHTYFPKNFPEVLYSSNRINIESSFFPWQPLQSLFAADFPAAVLPGRCFTEELPQAEVGFGPAEVQEAGRGVLRSSGGRAHMILGGRKHPIGLACAGEKKRTTIPS